MAARRIRWSSRADSEEVVAVHAEETADADGASDLARTVGMIVVDGQATAGCIGLGLPADRALAILA